MAAYGYCPSGRLFEAAACGTPILTDDWEGLNQFFSADEIFIVRDTESVLHALTLGDSNLQSMANRARERTLDQHTGDHRARELVNAIQRAGNKKKVLDEQQAEWVK